MSNTKPLSSQISHVPTAETVEEAIVRLDAERVVSIGTISDVTLSQASATYFTFPTTPNGWNTGAGRLVLQFDALHTNYFSANPVGHWAIVTRQDPALVLTDPVGHGIATGNATGFPGGASDVNPTTLIETYGQGTALPSGLDNYLWSASAVGRTKKLSDGVQYRYIVESVVSDFGERYLRYAVWSKDPATGAWISENDTGYVLDHNTTFDPTKTNVTFAHVFNSDLTAWSIQFTNIKYMWGPDPRDLMDITSKLSRFGADLSGELNFRGPNTRRVNTDAAGGFDLAHNGTTVANVASGGLAMAGASARVGTQESTYTNMTNFGGASARSFADATTLNIDTVCTDTYIRTLMSATPTNAEVEQVVRPLYCIVSVLVKALRDRKVM